MNRFLASYVCARFNNINKKGYLHIAGTIRYLQNNNMKNKIVMAFAVLLTIQFIASCCRDVKFFDYTQMEALVANTALQTGDSLQLDLIPTDIHFIASQFQDLGFAAAWSLSCDEGWGGMKLPVVNIEITSNAAFDNSHPANQSLNDLFKLRVFDTSISAEQYHSLPEVVSDDLSKQALSLLLTDRPTLSQTHVFTIKLTKINQEVITVESPAINWQ